MKPTDGRWVTINGVHVFVKNGQSVEDALNEHKKRNNGTSARLGTIISGRGEPPPKPFKIAPITIEIDTFTPCLVDVATGKIVETHVAKIDRFELKRYTKRNGWGVDWHEYSKSCEVFGVYVNEDDEPQGLIALEYKRGATYVGFAQAAPQNDKHALDGQPKRYEGVGGHLFALAVEQSSKNGGDGAVFGYAANARLLKHYCEKLGAQHLPIYHEYQFIIEDDASRKLLEKYTYERK